MGSNDWSTEKRHAHKKMTILGSLWSSLLSMTKEEVEKE